MVFPVTQNDDHIPPGSGAACLSRKVEITLGLVIFAVGAALRFWALDSVPPGLWFDEALNGQDAVRAAHGGGLKLVYPDEFPREPMYETILIGVTRLFGPSVVAYRMTSAVIGIITIFAAWGMMRLWAGREAALLTAGVLAAMRWHVIFSRLIFRTLMMPLWICLILIAAHFVRSKPTLHRSVLLGALIAGGFYVYLAWYFMLPGVIALAVWVHGPFWRDRHLRRCILCCLASLLFFVAPLSRHYKKHPEHLFARAEAVSLSPFKDPAGAFGELGQNFIEALGMFNVRGDHVPKQNLPHMPALNFHEGIFFLMGIAALALAIRRRQPIAVILLGWLALGMCATIVTQTDSPNFLRTLVLTPAVAAIVATGVISFVQFAAAATRVNSPSRSIIGLGLGVLAGSSYLTAEQVFRVWPLSTAVWDSFNGAQFQLGKSAASTPAGSVFWVPEYPGKHRTFQFLAVDSQESPPEVKYYVNLDFLRADAGDDGPRRVVVTAHNRLLGMLEQLAPQGAIVEEYKRPDGGVWGALYEIPPGALPAPGLVDEAERNHPEDVRW